MFLGSTVVNPFRKVEKKTASLAVPSAVEDDLDGTSKRKKGEQTPGVAVATRAKREEFTGFRNGDVMEFEANLNCIWI